jgi:UDP-glucose 4-epimerase
MSKQRIVMTGATGLIGRSVVDVLKGEHDLISVGRNPPPKGVEWVNVDLNSPLGLSSMPASADSVIYLAQSAHFRDFPKRAEEIFRVNIASVQQMLDWARGAGAQRFIYASSGGIYGHGSQSFREDDLISAKNELGYYLASKKCGELLAENYANCFTVVILRFFFVYGPAQRQTMLIPRLIMSVRDGEPIQLQGEDGIRINPTHVSDAVAATVRALELSNSHTINVGGPDVLSMREIVEEIGLALNRKPNFSVDQSSTPRHLSGDISKMRELLIPPRVSFSDGLRSML